MSVAEASARLFVALWPPLAWSQQLLQRCEALMGTSDGRRLLASDLHVTLAFLGAVPQAAVPPLLRALQPLAGAAVTLTFSRVVYWSRARCLVCEVEPSAPAAALAGDVLRAVQQLGLAPDERAWRGHVTLARSVRSPSSALTAEGAAWTFGPLVLRATQLALAQSLEPPVPGSQRYRQLASWALA